jgi:hypothetical protein
MQSPQWNGSLVVSTQLPSQHAFCAGWQVPQPPPAPLVLVDAPAEVEELFDDEAEAPPPVDVPPAPAVPPCEPLLLDPEVAAAPPAPELSTPPPHPQTPTIAKTAHRACVFILTSTADWTTGPVEKKRRQPRLRIAASTRAGSNAYVKSTP